MKEKEFRQIEDLLTLAGVQIFRAKGNADLEELRNAGYSVLWSSAFGRNLRSGDCETIALAAKTDQPSQQIVDLARNFGAEFVRREREFFGKNEEVTEQVFTEHDAYAMKTPEEFPLPKRLRSAR